MRNSLFLLLVVAFTCIFYSCEQELDVVEYDQITSQNKTVLDPLILADVNVGSCCGINNSGRVRELTHMDPHVSLESRTVTFSLNSTTHTFYAAQGGLKYVFYRKDSNGDYKYYKTSTSLESTPDFCLRKGEYKCIIIANGCSFTSIDWDTDCSYAYIGGKSCNSGIYFAASDAICFTVNGCRMDITDIDDQG